MNPEAQETSLWDLIQIRDSALDPARLETFLTDPSCGALTSFVGRVRSEHQGRAVSRLDYECFEPLARREMQRLAQEARQRWKLGPLVLAHRVGRLDVGDVAVVVAVTSAHRDEGFAACRFLIEELKAKVPIWKHEFFAEGGEAWVGAPSQPPGPLDALSPAYFQGEAGQAGPSALS
jgi:molybdopterin synthase catalytic subunit